MARVITPAGLDLGDIQDETLLTYYRGEQYTFPDDEPVELSATEPVSLDLSKSEAPADVAGLVDDGVTPDADAAAGALPEPTDI